jgi:hypothetical protein
MVPWTRVHNQKMADDDCSVIVACAEKPFFSVYSHALLCRPERVDVHPPVHNAGWMVCGPEITFHPIQVP